MWYQKRGNKYNAKSSIYEGVAYDSKKEAGRATELDLLLKAKAIKGWERQRRISFDHCLKCLRLCSVRCPEHPKEKVSHFTNYYIDFVIHEKDGTETYEEVKGFETTEWRKKWHLTELLYGNDENIKLVVNK